MADSGSLFTYFGNIIGIATQIQLEIISVHVMATELYRGRLVIDEQGEKETFQNGALHRLSQ
jgi:hypothetical protein